MHVLLSGLQFTAAEETLCSEIQYGNTTCGHQSGNLLDVTPLQLVFFIPFQNPYAMEIDIVDSFAHADCSQNRSQAWQAGVSKDQLQSFRTLAMQHHLHQIRYL
ncbi:hypothetical protein ASE08_23670 [Rhizobacter sp. Root16D2]|nr:hypothetical protein ASC88_12645 [Rhizobacter sp. Root29]KQW11590.1 hypothetical protein ASC98_21850 [Rhizobacter sp. Root1238]KRB19846.1 hypothetical protein ASE08_23670 [Rhizobacter sp. Root16D2]